MVLKPQDFLHRIVESSEDAIIGEDLNGGITLWNGAAERMFGYSRTEAIGRSVELIVPADKREQEREVLDRATRGERIEHYETHSHRQRRAAG